jgi:hypothetical protein
MKTVQKYIPSTAMLLVETTATEDVYIALSDYSALEKEKEELAKLAGEFAEELINMKIKPYGMMGGRMCYECGRSIWEPGIIMHADDCIVGRAEAYKEGV